MLEVWDPAEQVDWMKGFRWIPYAFTTSHITRHFFLRGYLKHKVNAMRPTQQLLNWEQPLKVNAHKEKIILRALCSAKNQSEDHFFSEHYTLCFRLNHQLIFFPLFRFQVISWLVSHIISHIVDLLHVKPRHGHSLPLAKPSFTHFLLISYAILVLFCQDCRSDSC